MKNLKRFTGLFLAFVLSLSYMPSSMVKVNKVISSLKISIGIIFLRNKKEYSRKVKNNSYTLF